MYLHALTAISRTRRARNKGFLPFHRGGFVTRVRNGGSLPRNPTERVLQRLNARKSQSFRSNNHKEKHIPSGRRDDPPSLSTFLTSCFFGSMLREEEPKQTDLDDQAQRLGVDLGEILRKGLYQVLCDVWRVPDKRCREVLEDRIRFWL